MTSRAQPRRRRPHIANIDFARFFSSAFGGIRPAREFYNSLKGIEGPEHRAMLIINQTARLLWLADRTLRVSRGRPALQIMFFMIVAEAVAKLFANAGEEESFSKLYARSFFLLICSDEQRGRVMDALRIYLGNGTLPGTVTHLYRIRCDVVHRWNYYGMSLPPTAVSSLRSIVLDGAAHAARTLVNDPQKVAEILAAIEAQKPKQKQKGK